MATQVGLDHDAVVDAAGELVDEAGVEALTLAALAARLGIRSQSLYAHVDGLDGLLRDLALDSVRHLGDELRSSVIGRSGRDALEAIADAYWDFARAHPGRTQPPSATPATTTSCATPTCAPPRRSPGCSSRSGSPAPTRCTRTARCGRASTASSRSSTPGVLRRPASVRESYRRMIAMFADALEADARPDPGDQIARPIASSA